KDGIRYFHVTGVQTLLFRSEGQLFRRLHVALVHVSLELGRQLSGQVFRRAPREPLGQGLQDRPRRPFRLTPGSEPGSMLHMTDEDRKSVVKGKSRDADE